MTALSVIHCDKAQTVRLMCQHCRVDELVGVRADLDVMTVVRTFLAEHRHDQEQARADA